MSQIIELMKVIPWWPLTILVLAVVFRYELRGIAKRLQHLKYGDIDLTFQEDLRQAEKEVSKLPQPEAAEIISKPGASKFEEAIRIAELSPRASIEIAWREVELAIREAAIKHGLVADKDVPLSTTISALISNQLIPEDFQVVLERLQRMRDQALHAPAFALGVDETKRFIQLARGVSLSLANLLRAQPDADIRPR